jgi:hypothetical protein
MEWNLVFARNKFLNLLLNLLIANPDLLIANPDLLLANSDLLLANPDLLIANPDLLIAKTNLLTSKANVTATKLANRRPVVGWREIPTVSSPAHETCLGPTFGFHSDRKTAKCLICRTFLGSLRGRFQSCKYYWSVQIEM